MNTDGLGGYYAFGLAAFSCLITAMNYRAAFLTLTWNWISLVSMFAGSFGLYCVFISIYGLLPWTPMYMVPFKVFSTPLFWLIIIAVPLQTMAVDLLVSYILAEFFPTDVHLLSELTYLRNQEGKGEHLVSTTKRVVDAINKEHETQVAQAINENRMRSARADDSGRIRSATEVESSALKSSGRPNYSRQGSQESGLSEKRGFERQTSKEQNESRSFAFNSPEDVSPSRFAKLTVLSREYSASLRSFLPSWKSWEELKADVVDSFSWTGLQPAPEAAPTDAESKRPPDTPFLQQKLPSKHFVLTGGFVKWSLFTGGIFFVYVGWYALLLSEGVAQIRVQYDGSPVYPKEMSWWSFSKVLFARMTTADMPFGTRLEELHQRDCGLGTDHSGRSRTCSFTVPVTQDMQPPIQVMYLVNPFYQNYNRYMRSVDMRQLKGRDVASRDVRCHEALVNSNGEHLNPCGLQAQSFFNDTFQIMVGNGTKSAIVSKSIVFPPEIEDTWKNPPKYGRKNDNTSWLYERFPGIISYEDGVNDRHFMVHMRPGALGYAQKRYGVIHEPLHAGQNITLKVDARFPVKEFDGRKFVVLTTESSLGGRNDFLGYELMLAGIFSLIAAGAVAFQQWYSPRRLGHWRGGANIESDASPRVD
jgi:hypothetical protein